MKISLKKLTLRNFKGQEDLEVSFEDETNVYGYNETGKSTLFDAFTWALFSKDSLDRKDFDIKNTVKRELNRLDHEVIGLFSVDGKEVEIRHVYKEKWTKKRGSETSEMTGHIHEYFWNDVPIQENEMKLKVNDILKENIFKLITNPLYFNGLKWQERREILVEISGVTDEDIFSMNPDFQELKTLLAGKGIEGLKAQISAKKKKLKDELDLVPARIDEVNRQMPEDRDWANIENKILINKGTIADIEKSINDKNEALKEAQETQMKIQRHIYKIQNDKVRIENDIRREIDSEGQDDREELTRATKRATALESERREKFGKLEDLKINISIYQKDRDILRKKWEVENAHIIELDEHEFSCPTCKRAYEATDIEAKKVELTKNFNADKVRKLGIIQSDGVSARKRQEELEAKVLILQDEILELETAIINADERVKLLASEKKTDKLNPEKLLELKIAANLEYQSLSKEIESLEASIEEEPKPDYEDLKDRKSAVQNDIETLAAELSVKKQIEKLKERRSELEDREKILGQELASQERLEFTIQEFMKAKIDMLETEINRRFDLVRFKMFNEQINGGLAECCETMYKGVPWSVLNTAGKIEAGIDIINTLCKHYDTYAPCFIDNRESIINIPETESQIINLIVSKPDKKMRIEYPGIQKTRIKKQMATT